MFKDLFTALKRFSWYTLLSYAFFIVALVVYLTAGATLGLIYLMMVALYFLGLSFRE